MPIEIICHSCGAVLYSGFDLKSPKEVVRATDNKCKACGHELSINDFSIEISKTPHS
jgi:RNase P subunit RPR2